MKKHFTITLNTKVPTEKILYELEVTCNEFVERDEDLTIKHEKKTTKPRKPKKKNR
jgi:hypothetical protein